MSNFGKAVELLSYADLPGRTLHPRQVWAIVNVLQDAGLLAPDTQAIRTVEELEALEPDTVLVHLHDDYFQFDHQCDWVEEASEGNTDIFPLAVLAHAPQVRAAWEALEEEDPTSE